MARVDWEERLALFAKAWRLTGITPQQWCEENSYSWGTAKAYITVKAAKAFLSDDGEKIREFRKKNRELKVRIKLANSRILEAVKNAPANSNPGSNTQPLLKAGSDDNSCLDHNEFGVSEQQATFAKLIVDGMPRADAYKKAGYKCEGKAIHAAASQILRNISISRYIHYLRNERQKRYVAELDEVIAQLTAIINADPNEIAQYRRVNCRCCWGEGHKYQWRDLDEQLQAERKAEEEKKGVPDFSGGVGFVDNSDPNPDCPRCQGEGVGEAFFADTRDLVGDARYLLQGVKLGKFGIEISTSDKDAARRELARLIMARDSGSRKDALSHQLLELEIRKRTAEAERLEQEVELNRKGGADSDKPTLVIKLVNSPDAD